MSRVPGKQRRAVVAVDLGAESCRVSLLRWFEKTPSTALIHRLPNGPVRAADGSLRWPLDQILAGVEHGLRLCAERAPEGIASIGVDGWAVDYVRLDPAGKPLEPPFCYRDERFFRAQESFHQRISATRLREITGLQLQPLNTLYQMHADRLEGRPAGSGWLNLPEYFLAHWGGRRVAEYTNASHTQMLELATRGWSPEILRAAEIASSTMPPVVPPGTILGYLRGPLADLAPFHKTQLIAPACHDTASAVASIPAEDEDWGYVSCGTWSLVGTCIGQAANGPDAQQLGLTNLGLDEQRLLLQKNMNGLWLLQQCLKFWSAQQQTWSVEDLCAAAESFSPPDGLLDLEDPDLLGVGNMPQRINQQRCSRGLPPLDESAANAPQVASLIFHSLAAQYARLFGQLEEIAQKNLRRIYFVGGGSRNALLRRLTAEASGREILAACAEASTAGNFAIQLATLAPDAAGRNRERVAQFARLLSGCIA
jgi:rhamnulokinase